MRNNQFTFVLVGLLFLCTLWTAWLLFRYNRAEQRLEKEQPTNLRVAQFYSQQVMNPMLNEVLEYSKKNPAIDPLLLTYGIRVDRSGAAK